MSWQDIVFAAGSVIFTIALLPAVFCKVPPPLATCLTTGSILSVFVVTYCTLQFWFAAATTTATAICWFVLAWQAAHEEHLHFTQKEILEAFENDSSH